MRELTRSMIRLSWALPLLGMDQMASLVMPGGRRRPLESSAETFDRLAEAASSQMAPGLRDLYEQGDRLQRRVVDALFDVLGMGGSGGAGAWSDPARRRAEGSRDLPLRPVASGADAHVGAPPPASPSREAVEPPGEEPGWGPVPAD